MPSVGHVAVGLAAARVQKQPQGMRRSLFLLLLVILSCLPDADVLAFRFGVPYSAPFGHRGAFHSLAVAVLCGVLVAGLARLAHLPALRLGVAATLVMASHGVLDTLTDGGLGIALLWPFSHARYFAPWQPIPVAPLGRRLLSAHGVHLMAHEVLMFLPLFAVGLWPRRNGVA